DAPKRAAKITGPIKQRERPLPIRRHALAVVIEDAKIGAAQRIAPVAGACVEDDPTRVVHRHALAPFDGEDPGVGAGLEHPAVTHALEHLGRLAAVTRAGALQVGKAEATRQVSPVAGALVERPGARLVTGRVRAGGKHVPKRGAALHVALGTASGAVEEIARP